MKIKASIEKIPGGMMVVPLFFGAVINTIFPSAANVFGSFTGAIMTGSLPILGVFYFCVGATVNFKASPYILKKGLTFLLTKVCTAAVVGLIANQLIPNQYIKNGFFAGLSVLAIVAAMNETNVGMWMALMAQFGRKEDIGASSIMMMESGPFLTMVTFGATGLGHFPWQFLVGTIIPFVFGMVLGNLDGEMRGFFGNGVNVLIPFFSFALGAGLNLTNVAKAGYLGIFLAILVIVTTGSTLFLADKFTGGNGTAGIAAASSAGACATVPAAMAAANHKFAIMAPDATALVVASVVVTSIVTPFLTAWWSRRIKRRQMLLKSNMDHLTNI
ncbi:2-keto-3-deoxygluconate permease [Alicyclobacillus acidoterrestris]|uniref:2-keto-3-deoxygluconate permease n=1 Tax=Alicyclobacillus suci TaxID=2816080 RepID=UPI001196CD72|nr:2-keto-3-deoxygluconate permease [Alicyclobacillus suci]GEO27074.1 2-keto-3-deoxygluconate permease [Alicyclobacillus acidoterrestris]